MNKLKIATEESRKRFEFFKEERRKSMLKITKKTVSLSTLEKEDPESEAPVPPKPVETRKKEIIKSLLTQTRAL